jgi:hypothetical protein
MAKAKKQRITIVDGLDFYSFTIEVLSQSNKTENNLTEKEARNHAYAYAIDKGIELSDGFVVLID